MLTTINPILAGHYWLKMKCPICAKANLVRDTRDLPYTYKGEATVIPAVTGDFCPACGESIHDVAASTRMSALMLEFNQRCTRYDQQTK